MKLDNSSGFLRLFIAISVPETVCAEIARAQGRLKRECPLGTVRWTRPDQFHITLKFLGDVPVDQVDDLKTSVAAAIAGFPSLQISADGVGFFPNERSPRVIWVGVHDSEGILAELCHRIDQALRRLASAEPAGNFKGHVTLGRFKPGHRAAISRIMKHASVFHGRHFGDWQAGEVELVRSKLSSAGAEHSAIATYPLAMS